MGRFRIRAEQPDDVLPQIVPLVGAPRIVALEGRHPVAQPVAHELAERVVGRVEVHVWSTAGHPVSKTAIPFLGSSAVASMLACTIAV